MENYKVISINGRNGGQGINHTYQRRVGKHYQRIIINGITEEEKLLEQIANHNEKIIRQFKLNKLEVKTHINYRN